MPTFLHAIQTWTPDSVYSQPEASRLLEAQTDNKRTRRILRHIYRHTDIDTRHTAVGEFGQQSETALFRDRGDGRWVNPGTGDRNRTFAEVSKSASVELARRTLKQAKGVEAGDITHVITASCTGFYSPGPEYHITRGLGLSDTVQRFHLGFMGCFAAFPAMRMADQICRANPEAVVLIQCLELCSLHLQLETDNEEALVSGALFADGAGCALISAKAPAGPGYRIRNLSTTLTPTGEESMAWEVGNHGYEIVLTSYVPHILGENIRSSLLPRLQETGWTAEDIDFWAVHPGGKAILDRIGEALELSPEALELPREILRRYGNMSSATIFFVLQQGLETAEGDRTAAMAFGPGLTVEMAFLERL